MRCLRQGTCRDSRRVAMKDILMLAETAAAWHVRFETGAPAPDAIVLASYGHPLNCRAVAVPVDFASILAQGEAGRAASGVLELLTIPTGTPLAPDLNRQIEAWPAAGQPRNAVIDVSLRSTRVLAAGTRAAVFCKPDQIVEAVDGALRFIALQQAVTRIEREVETNFDAMASYAAPLQRPPVQDPRAKQARMNDALGAKVALFGLQRSIEQFDPAIPAHSRRLFGDLAASARLEDRMEYLEEPVHAIYDYYDAEAWRKDDKSHFHISIFTEVLILVVLLGELGVMIAQYFERTH